MFLRVHETPEKILVTLEVSHAGPTDLHEDIHPGLRSACEKAARGRKRMLIDLRAIPLLNEMMCELLATGHRCGDDLGVDVRFAVRENVMEAVTVTRLNRMFRFDNDDPDLQ
jgi:anti-anti-sigma regulatory factor